MPLLLFSVPYGVLTVGVFAVLGVHRGVLRYIAGRDLLRIVQAVVLVVLVMSVALFLVTRLENVPRSALAILCLLHVAFAAGPRLLPRLWRERKKNGQTTALKTAVVIGANDTADLFLRELSRMEKPPCRVVGLIDDDAEKIGRNMHGLTVEGDYLTLPKTLEAFAEKYGDIDLLVLTEASQAKLDGLIDLARTRKMELKRLPNMAALEAGEHLTDLKPVLIEDLLGRTSRKLDMRPMMDLVGGKRVLVTGAGGSIGSELCRQIAALAPAHLTLMEQSELALYQIDRELAAGFAALPRAARLGDVRDAQQVDTILEEAKPDVIFHAAAYKHVPLVEGNPISGIETNLFGTTMVADAACRNKVPKMVVISTDKAVNPTNVMGATKRAAEIYCQNHPGVKDFTTNFVTVRFGNVLGSSGSVIPLFREQIKNGGPVTVTDKRAERYFMTIPEAVQLILRAAALEEASKAVLMLDMGKPVNIWNMAEEMVRLSGLVPHVDIEVKETGLRPGEKIKEELWYKEEVMQPTQVKEVFQVKPAEMDVEELYKRMRTLRVACETTNTAAAVTALQSFVPEYQPAENSPFFPKKSKTA